jgi:hypothetical protein
MSNPPTNLPWICYKCHGDYHCIRSLLDCSCDSPIPYPIDWRKNGSKQWREKE